MNAMNSHVQVSCCIQNILSPCSHSPCLDLTIFPSHLWQKPLSLEEGAIIQTFYLNLRSVVSLTLCLLTSYMSQLPSPYSFLYPALPFHTRFNPSFSPIPVCPSVSLHSISPPMKQPPPQGPILVFRHRWVSQMKYTQLKTQSRWCLCGLLTHTGRLFLATSIYLK